MCLREFPAMRTKEYVVNLKNKYSTTIIVQKNLSICKSDYQQKIYFLLSPHWLITGLTMKMKKYGFCLVDWISYFVLIKEKL